MKKFKHLLTALLSLCIILTMLTPVNAYAAKKPKLNKTSITVTSEKPVQLKVLNSTSKWKWKSSNGKIADVNSYGYVSAVKVGTCKVTATCGKKKLTCKVTVKQTDAENIYEISQWLCESMWNKGLCDLRDYYSTGRDSCGNKMNVDNTVKQFNKEYKKVDKYNKIINQLKGNKYKNLKTNWKKTITEMEKLHDQVNEIDWSQCPKDDEAFDTTQFQSYFNDLYELMCDLSY